MPHIPQLLPRSDSLVIYSITWSTMHNLHLHSKRLVEKNNKIMMNRGTFDDKSGNIILFDYVGHLDILMYNVVQENLVAHRM
jgi:hypothetical protein